jgi:hypothetical protein
MGGWWCTTGLAVLLLTAPVAHAAAPVVEPGVGSDWPLEGRAQAHFLKRVSQDLEDRGLEHKLLDGAVQLVADGQVTTLGLYNLASRCAVVSKRACGPLVAAHLDAALATQDDTDALSAAIAQGLEATLPRLRVMLWHPDSVPPEALAGLATRPVAPGLVAVLAWDSERTTGTVSVAQLDELGVAFDAIWDRVLANHAADPVDADWIVGLPGSASPVPALALESGDSYAATHVFRLDALRDRSPPVAGWLVALPSRSYAVAVPLDTAQPEAIRYLRDAAAQVAEPRPLTDALYWVHQGQWTPVLGATLPAALLEVLESSWTP